MLSVGAATLAGYAFSALRFPFRRILFMLLFVKMFMPGVMALVPSFVLASNLGLLNTPWVIALFCMGTSMPFWVFVMKVFVDGQPRELFEAMRIDGASEIRIFWHLALPLLRPMVALDVAQRRAVHLERLHLAARHVERTPPRGRSRSASSSCRRPPGSTTE